VGSFFSSYASSGSFTRSGLNYAAGAVTPMAAIFAALTLALVVLLVAPLAAHLPIAAMAAVLLVAHAFDMPRALAEFESAGIEAIPAPTGLAAIAPIQIGDFMPSAPALQASHDAVYEILANVVRVVSGR